MMTSARKVAEGLILKECIDAIWNLIVILVMLPFSLMQGRKNKVEKEKHALVTAPEARYKPEEAEGTTGYNISVHSDTTGRRYS